MPDSPPPPPSDPTKFDPSSTLEVRRGGSVEESATSIEDRVLRLEVIGGPMDGLRTRVAAPHVHVGRSGENDLALVLDPSVSGRHARIVREGRHFWLEDLESRNGTFVGDRRIGGRTLLSSGATFTVGRTRLEFFCP